MAFFENFTLVGYSITGENPVQRKIVTDILSRVNMLSSIKNQTLVYYLYDVQDGETPEIIASKYYDSPNKHWIILLANDIIDPYYDWVLSSTNFESYINSKYGSFTNATTQIHHYEKIITKTDSVTRTISVKRYEIDSGTYSSLPSSSIETFNLKDGNSVQVKTTKNIVYAYDYENELNESKRKIKIIDKTYVPQIEKEMVALLNTNV
jgi:hypothetical protein